MKRRSLPYLAQVGLLFALYVVTAKLGLMLHAVSEMAAAVWPPTGISLVALCLFGYRLWPGITLAAFLVNLPLAPPLAALGVAAGNTLEALLGAFLLQRVAGFRSSLDRVRDVIGLVVLAALFSTLVSASVGVTSGWLGGTIASAEFGRAWWTWWIGDMMGNLVVAPLLFVWSAPPRRRLSAPRAAEAAALLVAVTVVGLILFSGRFTTTGTNAAYLLFPFLIAAALRFGPHGAATAIFAVSAAAIWGTVQGRGPFATATVNESLLGLQTFMGVVAVTILVLAAEVTERRQAQAALREARDELEERVQERTAALAGANAALAEAQQIAHLGSWEWDIRRDLITWSDELYRIFGLQPQEAPLTYESYLGCLFPEDREVARETVERSYQDHRPFEFEHRVLHPDGTVRWVHGQGGVVTDAAGQPVRMLGTALDITERKRAEDELRRAHDELEIRVQERTAALEKANRAKDQFLAMLAHELRNPLAAILNAVHLLKHLPSTEPRLARACEIIERQVNQQVHLLDDLLNVSRIERGKIELRRQPLDLPRLVRDTAEDYRSLLEAAGQTLSLALPDEPVWVEGDPTRLAQVVSNLLQNATRFTDPGGQVTITLSQVAEWEKLTTEDTETRRGHGEGSVEARQRRLLRSAEPTSSSFPESSVPPPCLRVLRGEPSSGAVICVRDTGIGIDPELLPHVFEPFTQAEQSLDRSRGGLGLGLALVKGLVELHGGAVQVHSEGIGCGTEVTVLLPATSRPPHVEKAAEPAASGLLQRILIVEDNRDAAESLRDLLELSGGTVQVAFTGPEAVQIARQFRPDVVLCDLGLPGMDGYQVARELRAEPATASARLIALTGYGHEEHQQRSTEAGFDLHLTKPVDPDELQRVMQVPREHPAE